MGLSCGIVGLPNVGKSTLFNALTRAAVTAANFPFSTIDPNIGVVPVPDGRLPAIATIVQPREVVPATVEFVDIAGLVGGASQGEGLGNRFLSHIREVDAIAHVVRCFEDPDVAHVAGRIDPVADIDVVATELALADLETVERAIDREERRAKAGARDVAELVRLLETVRDRLDEGRPLRSMQLEEPHRELLRPLHLLTVKPTMYVANVAEGDLDGPDSPEVEEVRQRAVLEGAGLVVLAADFEAELARLDEADRSEFLTAAGLVEPGLERLIHAAYDLLGLGTFFTGDEKQARAWTFRRGMRAPAAGGLIHTDFERGFVRAEVVTFDDFVSLGGEAGARDAGRWRLEGRDYVVQDGDVIRFRFSV